MVALLAIALIVVAVAGYLLGHRARIVRESVGCLSADKVISCTLDDGWTVSVPLDVAWSDVNDTFHQQGRPTCLPPTGRGLEGPVQIAWTKVEAGDIGWRQVVWVGC